MSRRGKNGYSRGPRPRRWRPCAAFSSRSAPTSPGTSSTPRRSRRLGSTRWSPPARKVGARSRMLRPRRGVNERSRQHRWSGPATFGARAWSRSARRMLCATGSARRVGAADAWWAPRQVEPEQADCAKHVRSTASTQAAEEHGDKCRRIMQSKNTFWVKHPAVSTAR